MRPKVVLSGSYHQDTVGLSRIFRELEMCGCRILSPLSIDFISTNDSVVKTESESEFSIKELEKFHLRAIKEADFVWIHAPKGYVGLSAAFEIGFCIAIKKPIFAKSLPNDEMIRIYVTKVESVFDAIEATSF